MIPVATKATEVDNIIGLEDEEEVQFTIGDMGLVMRSLSKLYSNPILAVIREYSTNARDAHIEAGMSDVPISITLPTIMHPYFEIEDFGIGMTKDTLKKVYTAFGNSTKRESNEFNGMLGYGCKSALAYSDSFVVRSRKDGIETEAMIVRKADWSISLRVTALRNTDEPNGTKVQIPAREYDAFYRIAHDFYRFWQPGTVLVDGKEPEWAVGEKLDDNLYYSKSTGTSYVVMGNVAYRITNADALFRNRNMNSISFVAYVPNGSVEFTPSREDLEYTDHTKDTLYSVIKNFENKIVAQAKADIDTADDFWDAYLKYSYWSSKLGRGPFGELTFRGEKFVDTIKINGYRYRPSETRYNTFNIEEWHVSKMESTLIVTGMSVGSPSSTHKAKAKQYRDKIGKQAGYIIFTHQTEVKSVWVDQSRVVSWEDVKAATKAPRQPSNYAARTRVKGTFDYYLSGVDDSTGNWGVAWKREQDLPTDVPLYYITVHNEKSYGVDTALKVTKTDAAVVVLAANRIAKFTRDNPQVKSFVEEFKKKVNLNGVDFLDDDTKTSLALSNSVREWLKTLDVNQIDDPEFKRLKALIQDGTNANLTAYNQAFALAVAMQMRYNFKEHGIHRSDESLLDKYPLLKLTSTYYVKNSNKGDIILYINAKYAATSGKKGS